MTSPSGSLASVLDRVRELGVGASPDHSCEQAPLQLVIGLAHLHTASRLELRASSVAATGSVLFALDMPWISIE